MAVFARLTRRCLQPRGAADRFLDRLPKEFIYERQLLKARVWRSQEVWEYWKENLGGRRAPLSRAGR